VALSSDAHRPGELGHEYARAMEWLDQMGVGEIAVFERRRRRLERLG
jgi:histidinol phosphatase-like PHP family hydrolase